MTDRRALRAFVFALAAAVAFPACAQVLFKLIDRKGRVTYSDRQPKDFDGAVVRIEPDTASNVVPSAGPGGGEAKGGEGGKEAARGIGETRRAAREDLDKRLRAAQAKAEAARKAKAEGTEPLPEEMQTIQHRRAPLKAGQQPPNPNCFVARDASGIATLNCPSRIPDAAYYERQKKLEDDLARAEEELAIAERAYRRGTD